MEWRWIGVEMALLFHERQIAEHGGAAGIRDQGLLESALMRPQMLAAYGEPDVFDLAACYGWGISHNHPFLDGNKRTGFVVCLTFLRLHGLTIASTKEELLSLFLSVAAGRVAESELARWLRSHAQEL